MNPGSCLFLVPYLVFPFEHIVDFHKIVCIFDDGLRITSGRVALLQVCFFSQDAHLIAPSARFQ